MKRPFAAATAFMAVLLISACGQQENKKTYSGPAGRVEVTERKDGQAREMTVQSEEGTTTLKSELGTIPQDLGVPIYPHVKKGEGGTWSMSGMEGDKAQKFSSTLLFSQDPIDKVAAFYKEQLKGESPELFEMAMPSGKMVSISLDDEGGGTHIVLTEDKEKQGTNIQITKAGE